MRYKTKPFTIEAVQWTGDRASLDRVFEFMQDEMNKKPEGWLKGVGTYISHVWDYLQKEWIPVNEGDYIIRGMKGEYYPCDPEVFKAKYEPMLIEAAVGAVDEGKTDFGCFKVSDD